ncbi:facilitated trehalose transporter Tret1-like [Sitophilus oryzae]|uniref:Facilitated trehalose transporter Tret1-like n=1 Tax=Sitophilus oryzae TaxID=7048 RepID=A0A6J2YS78_SITOR|nr:facilitated trehalose transporter Tret1-like [Sitophilus oryzae]
MTRPVLLTENSRSVLVSSGGENVNPRSLPQFVGAFVSTFSAVCLGMVFTWTSPALPVMESEVGISKSQGAWIGSLVTLGAFVGAIPAGPLAQVFGRKRFLQMIIIPLFFSWIFIAYFYDLIFIVYLARFVAGFAGGAISVTAPMYVAEIAHISIRGTLGTFFQVQITIGILLAYLLGGVISDLRTLSLISSVFPLVFLLSFSFIPESPVYLSSKNQMDEANDSLVWFRGDEYDVEDELVKIIDDIEEAKKNESKLSDFFNCKATFKGLIISFGLMIFQQLSGVNAVLFYANDIFKRSGGSISPGASSILVGVVQVVATLCSTLLIDKAGRKILLILSDFVMCLALVALGLFFYFDETHDLSDYSFIPLISIASFIVFFSIGLGPIPWMIMGEIFLPKVKGTASSMSASLNWFLAFMVTNQFSNLVDCFGIGITFLVFGVICGVGTVFITILVPETKGKSIEEVSDLLLGLKRAPVGGLSNGNCDKMTTVI